MTNPLFIVGDVHGQYQRLVALLQSAGLIGPDCAWTGGAATLVCTGDFFDRGPAWPGGH